MRWATLALRRGVRRLMATVEETKRKERTPACPPEEGEAEGVEGHRQPTMARRKVRTERRRMGW
jgi:hypothetical protein